MVGQAGRAGPVAIRELRWWDIAAVEPLERELFGPTAWSPEVFWAELAQDRTRWYVVAEDDAGDLLGYAGLMQSGAEADVQTIAVTPSAQGRGVGAGLLRALLGEAARRGCTSVLLEVRADNDAAVALYRRFGFERISVRRAYYQPGGVDAWVMRLRPLRRDPAAAAPDRLTAAGSAATAPAREGTADEPADRPAAAGPPG